MSNRREFVAAATGGIVLSGLGATPGNASACNAVARRVGGNPAMAAFEALLGEEFELRGGAIDPVALRLVTLHEHVSRQPLEQFTLVLRGSDRQAITGGLYQLEHARTGRFQLRLDPSGRDALGPLYRAEFSLLI